MYCDICKNEMQHRDTVIRLVKYGNGLSKRVYMERVYCKKCHKYKRINEITIPFKHYAKDIIVGIVNGEITPDTEGFEDYPCEMTIKRWINERIF